MTAIGELLFVYISNSIVGQPGYGIYRSTDSGTSWVYANNGLTGVWVNSIVGVMDEFGKRTLYAGVINGVMKSIDNGNTWTSDGLENYNVSSFAVISDGIGGSNIIAGTNKGEFLSTGSGSGWTQVNSGMNDLMISALAVSPNNSGGTIIIAGTEGGNVYISSNNGSTWNAASTGLISGTWETGASINSFTVSGSDIYACTYAGLFQSDNNIFNWKPINDGIPFISIQDLSVIPNGLGNTNIFAGTFPSGVFLSTNNGSNWTLISLTSGPVMSLMVNGNTIFAGVAWSVAYPTPPYGVFISTNNGINWTQTALDSQIVLSLAAIGNNIFAGTYNGVFLSTNN